MVIEETKWAVASRLANDFVEGVMAEVAGFDDCYGDYRVEAVETEARDGFIPYTNGGWDGVAYAQLSYAYSSGHAPAAVQSAIDGSLKDAAEEFERANGITVAEMDQWEADEAARLAMPALPGMAPADTFVQHPLREKLWDMQDSWMSEGGTYFYKCRVMFYESGNYRNELGTDEVRLFAYLNTDYEYGRDYISWLPAMGGKADQTVDGFARTMTLAEFVALGEEGIADLVTEAVNSLAALAA